MKTKNLIIYLAFYLVIGIGFYYCFTDYSLIIFLILLGSFVLTTIHLIQYVHRNRRPH